MATINSLSDTPKYSIKAVCAQTGVMAVTLRAWERRYNLLTPHRTTSNYRLYSERDIATLRWLQSRVETGLSISSAAAELAEMRLRGQWPDAVSAAEPAAGVRAPNPPQKYAERLYKAIVNSEEDAASAVLAEAHSVFSLATVCLDVMTECLVMIGDAWHRGEISISTEHLASGFIRGRLMTLLQSFASRRTAPRIIMACPPCERHEIGHLMLATLLRRDGYRVDYLGTGIPSEDLINYVCAEKPAAACFTASSEAAAGELQGLYSGITQAQTSVYFGYGGRVFVMHPHLRQTTPGIYLGNNVAEGHACLQQLLN